MSKIKKFSKKIPFRINRISIVSSIILTIILIIALNFNTIFISKENEQEVINPLSSISDLINDVVSKIKGDDSQTDQTEATDQTEEEQTSEEEEPLEPPTITLNFWNLLGGVKISLFGWDMESNFHTICHTNRDYTPITIQYRMLGESWEIFSEGVTGGETTVPGEYDVTKLIYAPGLYEFRAILHDSEGDVISDTQPFTIYGFIIVLGRTYPYQADVNEPFLLEIYSHYPSTTIRIFYWRPAEGETRDNVDGYAETGTNIAGKIQWEWRFPLAGVWKIQAKCLSANEWSNVATLTVIP